MLDTDISSYIIKRRPPSLIQRFEAHAEELCVSVITAAELRFGAEKAGRPKLSELVEAFLERLSIPRLDPGGHAALRTSPDRLGAGRHTDRQHGPPNRIACLERACDPRDQQLAALRACSTA